MFPVAALLGGVVVSLWDKLLLVLYCVLQQLVFMRMIRGDKE
jgi:hypothetical protein